MELSRKQSEFIRKAHCRWNFKGGATRSGKTYLDCRWVIPMRIRERAGRDGIVVVLGVTKATIERNILGPMRSIYGPDWVGEISGDNTVWLFGERCYALGAATAAQVSKIRGASVKYCYGDEVADWAGEVFELLKSRLDREYSCFDGTFNPQHPEHWLKKFLDSGADIFCQTYTIDDNPFLTERFKESLKKEYAGSVFYDRYILGRWSAAEGLVYPMFQENMDTLVVDRVPEEARRGGKWYIAVDYGTVNPTAAGLWCVWGGKAWMAAEYYYDSRKTGRRRTDEEHYREIEKLAGEIPIQRVIADPSAASFKETIRRHGRFGVWDADNRVLDGIRLTASLLQGGVLRFHRSCRDILREFQAYRWDADARDDAVLKEYDHAMDQMRYFAATVMVRFLRQQRGLQRGDADEFHELGAGALGRPAPVRR